MKRVFYIVESFIEVNISIVSVYVFSSALTKFLYISRKFKNVVRKYFVTLFSSFNLILES